MLTNRFSKTFKTTIQKMKVFSLSFVMLSSSCGPIPRESIVKDSQQEQKVVQKEDTIPALKHLPQDSFEEQEKFSPAEPKRNFYHPNCLAQCPSGAANDNILVDHDLIVLSANINGFVR